MIKICATSDLHGTLPEIKESFDLMLLGGDCVELYLQTSTAKSLEWYYTIFSDWINSLPFEDEQSKVILIMGNHDCGIEAYDQRLFKKGIANMTHGRVVYLCNEEYIFTKDGQSIKIFGSPYCKIFGRWAYTRSNEELIELYSKIPNNCDILLTHDAPYGTSDMCYGWVSQGRTPRHIGNIPLRDAILEKQPKLNIHAHLHTSNHNGEYLGDTQVVCVSYLDEEYSPYYKPLVFKWPVNELLTNY